MRVQCWKGVVRALNNTNGCRRFCMRASVTSKGGKTINRSYKPDETRGKIRKLSKGITLTEGGNKKGLK